MTRSLILAVLLLTVYTALSAQRPRREFTRQDTLRGSITEERKWWDVAFYHLDIAVDPSDSTIEGSNTIRYRVLEPGNVMQIDLQPPLILKKVIQDGKELDIKHDGNAHFIKLIKDQSVDEFDEITVYYGGHPHIARRPPWSGGVQWEYDENGNPWIATSNQGIGASIWWPCKDHEYDEPDSMLISVNVPSDLIDVSNGRLRRVEEHNNNTKTYHWFVSNPINNYGVNINIGDYVNFSEVFQGEKGPLDCDYWVLRDNLEKAKEQFKQAPMMLEAFEHWFGPYPFYEDSYKLVEVPYPGMEHQSSVTYGNGYKNGFGGRDGSMSGWGMKFDFIIIHESGHEWFANSITYRDVADMWIHESFINYSENLYVEYHFGKEAGTEYVLGTRMGIRNDRPIIGTYNVNSSGSGDMYPKGGNMLHTLRQLIDDDEKWRSILRGLNEEFYHQTVTTEQIEQYIIDHSGHDLTGFFDQYLRDYRLPVLEYSIKDDAVYFRYSNCIRGFDLPLKVTISGKEKWIEPTTRWSSVEVDPGATFEVDPNFYVAVLNITGR